MRCSSCARPRARRSADEHVGALDGGGGGGRQVPRELEVLVRHRARLAPRHAEHGLRATGAARADRHAEGGAVAGLGHASCARTAGTRRSVRTSAQKMARPSRAASASSDGGVARRRVEVRVVDHHGGVGPQGAARGLGHRDVRLLRLARADQALGDLQEPGAQALAAVELLVEVEAHERDGGDLREGDEVARVVLVERWPCPRRGRAR